MTFLKRCNHFWNWFGENEEKLSEIIETPGKYSSDEIVDFVSQGVAVLSDKVRFNLGGDYEFTFAASGEEPLYYLLPFLVSCMPERYREKWHFFPYMQSMHGNSFDFGMYGQRIPLDSVQIGMEYLSDSSCFSLRFYQEQLCGLEEDACYNAFWIMLELMIGEGLSRIYIDSVEKAGTLEEGMFPLTELEQRLVGCITESGKELMTRPDERYTAYQFEPQENDELRYDVISGTSCFTALIDEYYNEISDCADALDQYGAKACFLAFPYDGNEDRSKVLNTRYELEDLLAEEILGERGSGKEIGIVLGGAMGVLCAYIDLLLYDEPAFLERIQTALKRYPYSFYLSEFRQHCELLKLTGEK